MGTDAPQLSLYRFTAIPRRPPVPSAGRVGETKADVVLGEMRTVAYKAIAYLRITYGEYTAQCDCCTTFRNTPEGVLPKAHYDNKVRDLVLDRIIKDGMSIERMLESLQREFLLKLSSGFVYNVLRSRADGPGLAIRAGPRRRDRTAPGRPDRLRHAHGDLLGAAVRRRLPGPPPGPAPPRARGTRLHPALRRGLRRRCQPRRHQLPRAPGRRDLPAAGRRRLAATIARSLPMDRPIRDGQLAMRSATIRSPVAPIDDREYAEARRVLEALDRDKRPFLVVVDAWRKVFRHKYWRIHGGRLPQEVQAIRLDRDTAIVTLPHEVFVELGIAI